MRILCETRFVNALLDCLLCEAPLSTFAPARRGAARRAVSRRWRLGERSAALGLGICALVAFHALVCSDMLEVQAATLLSRAPQLVPGPLDEHHILLRVRRGEHRPPGVLGICVDDSHAACRYMCCQVLCGGLDGVAR